MKVENQPNNTAEKTPKQPSVRKWRSFERFRRTQNTTSIYFLLWAIFTALSLFIVLLSVFTQQYMLSQAYREQATRELAEKGRNIERSHEIQIKSEKTFRFSRFLFVSTTIFNLFDKKTNRPESVITRNHRRKRIFHPAIIKITSATP